MSKYVIDPNPNYEDSEWLWEQYWSDGKSVNEIADETSVGEATIRRRMDEFGIERRTALKDRPPHFYVDNEGYERWKHSPRIGDSRENWHIAVHRLIAVAEYGFEEVVDMDIHHKNGIPWDNRPDNLVPMDHSEHSAMHSRGE